jgi:pimeloyl-ACP methyl ester carboxylesterase
MVPSGLGGYSPSSSTHKTTPPECQQSSLTQEVWASSREVNVCYHDYIPASSPAAFAPQSPSDHHDEWKKPVLVLTSAWPFSSKMWDHILVPLVETHRLSCIVPDGRGYGKSEWSGPDTLKAVRIDYDTFASHLVQILDTALEVSSASSSPALRHRGSLALAIALDAASSPWLCRSALRPETAARA